MLSDIKGINDAGPGQAGRSARLGRAGDVDLIGSATCWAGKRGTRYQASLRLVNQAPTRISAIPIIERVVALSSRKATPRIRATIGMK